MRIQWAGAILLLPLLAGVPHLRAQGAAPRGVARLSVMNGDVSTQRGDSGDWVAAALNAPLLTGDRVATGSHSRAELQFDRANFLRMGENTEVELADLENGHYQVRLSRGILTYRLFSGARPNAEIDMPAVAVRPLQPGAYRVEVTGGGQTEITVREGRAEVASSQGTETLAPGRTLLVRLGPADSSIEAQDLRALDLDDWDRWNQQRDEQVVRARSYQYVPPGVYGAEDLDANGTWRQDPAYGPVWYPQVDAGWAPYTCGRWVWMDWYGWTWVPCEPWGWAPFHYGRWFFRAGFGWGWCPGPRIVFASWCPALVGFFGFGPQVEVGIGFGFGFGNIGWVALAPGERLIPWWGHGFYGGHTVINNINITNITNIQNVYQNAGVNGGIAGMNVQHFGQGAAVVQRFHANQIGTAGQIRGLVPVVPTKASLRFSDRQVTAGVIPRSNSANYHFFSARQPAPVQRTPFLQQQQQIAQSVRAQVSPAFRNAQEGSAAGSAPAPSRPIRMQGANGAVEAAGAPLNRGNAGSTAGVSSGGWRRLGDGAAVNPGTMSHGLSAAPAAPNSRSRAAQMPYSVPNGGNPGWRSLGQRSAPLYTPPEAQPSAVPRHRAPTPGNAWFGRSSEPFTQDGGGRQLHIHQPIVTQRAPDHPGGGWRSDGGGYPGGRWRSEGGGHAGGGGGGHAGGGGHSSGGGHKR
jgi:hypothetical protein